MIGPSLKSVFASRWKALWWSVGILFTAWQMVPAPEDGDTSAPAAASAPAKHVNPWAKDPVK